MTSIEIKASEAITLNAGRVEETVDGCTIHPPSMPMIDQLITQLDALPECEGDFQIQHLGVAFTALCVRWGSYLASLMDAATELHPAIPGFHKKQPPEYSFINDSEMQRLNIEISFNVYRLVQVFRERESIGLTRLLWKAYAYLPMPHQRIPKNVRATKEIYAAVITGMHTISRSTHTNDDSTTRAGGNGANKPTRHHIARANADRFLSNALACQSWRATIIESIHTGIRPPQGCRPHQQRFTRNAQLAVLREVTANFGGILYAMNMLFDEAYESQSITPWPDTATAIANSAYSLASWEWSLTDSASTVWLER
jgi:hypothetical protein